MGFVWIYSGIKSATSTWYLVFIIYNITYAVVFVPFYGGGMASSEIAYAEYVFEFFRSHHYYYCGKFLPLLQCNSVIITRFTEPFPVLVSLQ